jgi:hypothetical protein
MKKYLIVKLLLFSGIALSQSTGKLVGNGGIWYDSLTTYSATSASDSSYIIDLNLTYSYPQITVSDTGAVIDDSLKLYKGHVIYYNPSSAPSDTIWDTDALPVKNNVWGNDTTLVGGGVVKTYTILDGAIRLLEVRRVNAVVVAGNTTKIIVEGIKQK